MRSFFSWSQRAMLAAPCHLQWTKIITIMQLFDRCESSGGKHSHHPCTVNTEKEHKHKESKRLSALVFGFIRTSCFTHQYNVHHSKRLKEKGLAIIHTLLIWVIPSPSLCSHERVLPLSRSHHHQKPKKKNHILRLALIIFKSPSRLSVGE